jgi:hypothetical protein
MPVTQRARRGSGNHRSGANIYPASADDERTEDPETGEPFEGNELGWIDPRALDAEGNLLSPREMAQ